MNLLFQSEPIHFNLPDAEIIYYPNFYKLEEANFIFDQLKTKIPWQQDEIRVFGKIHLQPRLTALFGNKESHTLIPILKCSPILGVRF